MANEERKPLPQPGDPNYDPNNPFQLDKFTIYVNADTYDTSIHAIEQRTTGLKETIPAGEYWVLRKVDGAVLLNNIPIDSFPLGWISTKKNDELKRVYVDGVVDDPAEDPSNTAPTESTDKQHNMGDTSMLGNYNIIPPSPADPNRKRKPLVNISGEKVEDTSYIKNLITGTVIDISSPSELSDGVAANFDDISIRGRSSQLKGYDGSGPRSVSWSTTIHEEYCEEGLVARVARLKALCYPAYAGATKPPSCYVKIGKAVRGVFVVNSVNAEYQKPYRDDMYLVADVSIDLTEAGQVSYSSPQIEEGYGMTK